MSHPNKLFRSDFDDALEAISEDAQSSVEKGRRFERLMRRAFQTHPYEYGPARFKNVWLWSDWPDREQQGYGQDIGIDLVAEQTDAYGGGLCAIQCKFYAEDHKVPTSGVNSFLAASQTAAFTSRILVITSDLEQAGWTKVKKAAAPRCEVIGPEALGAWPDPWRELLDNPDDFAFSPETKHTPREDQREALDAIAKSYQHQTRGRVIMPCGTGKSVVALWAAEENVGRGGTVLYLVPSIALMGQTMREWARHRTLPHTYLGICSDKTTGRRSEDGDAGRDLAELSMPVSTHPDGIAAALAQSDDTDDLRVVFCTYQSLPTLADVVESNGLSGLGLQPEGFDLVVCDEAHRTTGVEALSDAQSAFHLVHDTLRVPASFRLFMTATQRIYTDAAKDRAFKKDDEIYSMDNEDTYGALLYEMSFKDAIDNELLSDYEVLIVATSERHLTPVLTAKVSALNAEDSKRVIVDKDDAVKLLGIWDALADPTTLGVSADRVTGELPASKDRSPLTTAIAFTNRVATSKAIAGPSAEVEGLWQTVVTEHSKEDTLADRLAISVAHIDGSTPAVKRAIQLDRLRDEPEQGACRVITNARVLTEGVDVPALDAVVFLQPRTSQIDIVQAVGRVMRRHPIKQKGYIVLPVVVPEGNGVTDAEVLKGSDFAVVWNVVRALRSHDERMDMWVNNADAARHAPIRVIDRTTDEPQIASESSAEQLRLVLDERIASKMVDACGDRQLWPSWGQKAAKVCREVRKKVDAQLTHPDVEDAFVGFVEAMRSAVGEHLTEGDAAEMVSQHVVTIPIFDCLFEGSEFAKSNPISVAMNDFLAKFSHVKDSPDGAALARLVFEDELKPLNRAYTTMSTVFEGAVTPAAKVDVLREIYDGFFQAAMKDVVGRLGIVYTPVEIVDFIIRSADAVCRKHFGQGLTDESVNVLDPFAGTGTFIYRLLTIKDKDGNHIIRDKDLLRKYFSELHANELVLLAYYIAAIKIEAGMAERDGFPKDNFVPFSGITFGDTFLNSDAVGRLPGLSDNTARKSRQGSLPIRAIIMNPPWSAGQKSAGDDNPNIDYPELAERVQATYGKMHKKITKTSGGGKTAGNLYVQAIRWASDRLNWPR